MWYLNTVGKSRSGLLHSLLLRMIWTAFSRYCWGWSGPQSSRVLTVFSPHCWGRSGLPSFDTAESGQLCKAPDCHLFDAGDDDLGCLKFSRLSSLSFVACQSVTLALSFCCFPECSNLSTRTRGFCMPGHSAKGPGEWILVEMMGQGVWTPPWKFQPISSMFNPWKSQISLLFGMAPSPGGFPLSTLAPKWAAFKLPCVLNIVSKCHIYVFYIKIPLQLISVQRRRCRHARHNYLRPGLYIRFRWKGTSSENWYENRLVLGSLSEMFTFYYNFSKIFSYFTTVMFEPEKSV